MNFDFRIDLHTDALFKEGHYLRAETRDATREEILLWGRILDLEKILDERLEPFVEGESVRVLTVGRKLWVLKYESDDWRKNVRSKVTEALPAEYPGLQHRARIIHERIGLPALGIDFIGKQGEHDWRLLEVNAYPGLDNVVEAQETFRELLCRFASDF